MATIFVKTDEGTLIPRSFIIDTIRDFYLNMTPETIIDLPTVSNKFVYTPGVKRMEGSAVYLLHLLIIMFMIMLLVNFLLIFCEIGSTMGTGSFDFWTIKVSAIFIVAYITAIIVFIPSMRAAVVICSRDD